MEEEGQVAIFIDFENLAIASEEVYGRFDLGVIMEAAAQWGRSTMRKAYCDWTGFSQYQQDLIEHSVELTQLFRYSSKHRKNAADIQMVVDALETMFAHPEITTFVLVTGDSDFSAVARKLRGYGKMVVGIGMRQSTSEVLVKACDHFILYDTLMEPDTRSAVFRLERARQLLLDAMRMLTLQLHEGDVRGSPLKMMMLRLDPLFNEAELGYRQFRDFLESQSDLVKVDRSDKDIVVQLKPSVATDSSQEESLEYRVALLGAGLLLMDPHIRASILQDLYRMLHDAPGVYTLNELALRLKARYDAENILRSKEQVQEVVKLLRYADIFESQPKSWNLDPLTLQFDLTAQAFVDCCESAYLVVFLKNNLPISPDIIARLLFGTLDQSTRVTHLAELAEQSLLKEDMPLRPLGIPWDQDGPCYRKDAPELDVVLRDLESIQLAENPSLSRAAELNAEGLRVRTVDFEQARIYFLQAARMVCDLLHEGEPGASQMELEWYLASYCAATAGANFYRFAYDEAATYYLAFFALAKETEPVWEKVQGLVEPMLSFYFTLAANVNRELLEFPPGRTHPARIVATLAIHPNPKVRSRWFNQARDLQRVNSPLLRIIIQRLEIFEQTADIPGTQQARIALRRVVSNAESIS